VEAPLDPRAIKRKLASGPKSIYTRNRVFLIAPLVAESLRKNAFPYDALVSGRSVYAYASGDPVDNTDPTGEFVPLIVILPAIGGLVGGIADVLSAGECENKFAAFGRGFVSGAVGTLAGIGVIATTGNPWLAGAAAGTVSQGLDQTISGQYNLPNAVVGTVTGGILGGAAAKALPTIGRLPNLLTPRTSSNMGLNSLRLVGQEAGSDVTAAGVAVAVPSNSSDECRCKQH
jgi:hypothetical protein